MGGKQVRQEVKAMDIPIPGRKAGLMPQLGHKHAWPSDQDRGGWSKQPWWRSEQVHTAL